MRWYREDSSIDQAYQQLQSRANLVYKFATLYGDYLSERHDYGTGQLVTMVEVHTLTSIEENPGITVTGLAQMNHRTKGAISQVVSKLVAKGLVSREKRKENAKTVPLFCTEDGQKLSLHHKAYDVAEVTQTMEELLRNCSIQEVDNFFKVMSHYINLME